MFVDNRHVWLGGVLAVVIALAPARAEEKKGTDSYRAAIEARAAKADQDQDVQALIESAYALYPLERAAKAKTPRYAALLTKAADIVIAKKDADGAKRFLELAGPLASGLPDAKKDAIAGLAVGKPIDEVLKEDAARVRGPVKKMGTAIADPEVKTRGGLDRDLAETLGKGALIAVRPTSVKYGSKMSRYKWSYPAENRATLYVEMDWQGFWTGNPYQSKMWIKFMVNRDSIEVLGIDYDDDCFFPAPDVRLLNRFVREINEAIRK